MKAVVKKEWRVFMKWIRSLLGYTIVATIVMSVWSEMGSFGIFGGYAAAIIIIGPMWFLNHYLNLTDNKAEAAFVDMGLAIGVAGIMRDTFIQGTEVLISGLPTIILVVIGAVLGGVCAAYVERDMAKDVENQNLVD